MSALYCWFFCRSISSHLISSHHIYPAVLYRFQVVEVESKTAGGVLLTDSAKEKPVIGTVGERRAILGRRQMKKDMWENWDEEW